MVLVALDRLEQVPLEATRAEDSLDLEQESRLVGLVQLFQTYILIYELAGRIEKDYRTDVNLWICRRRHRGKMLL